MANILKNPSLAGFKLVRYFTDKNGNVGAIEAPDGWEYVYTPMHPEDSNLIPQSLHRDRGFCIAAGWRKWEAGYVQRGVPLKKGQRYLCKAVFMPDVNFGEGQPVDLTAIQWQFWLEGGGDKLGGGWQSTGRGQYKQEEETLFVVEAANDVAVDFYFKVKSDWAGNVCDFNLYQLVLEEVPAGYGGPTVPKIGGAAQASAEATTVMLPTSPGPSADIPIGFARVMEQGGGLAEVITNDDIDVIVMGLREMRNVTPNQTIVAAFMRLADVLERLRK